MEEQLDVRELEWGADSGRIQPRRIYCGDQEIYYLDHHGNFWDEMSGKQLNYDEVVAARLDEIKHIHSYDVYEKVPLEE